jgi:thiol-disulfide isomerase/thioredoxin
MDMSKETADSAGKLGTWLVLGGVFVAAVAVTIAIGTRGSSTETTYPDLGDIASRDPNLPNTAEHAPTFVLPTLDGNTFDLADHISTDGRPVVLNLWASWCGPCRSEMPAINQAATEHPEVAFVGVSIKDDVGDATAFAGELGIGYTIAFDDGTVEEAYPALGLPATFFIDGDGVLLKTHFGVVTVDSLDQEIAGLFGS